jgi:hypothetical protein
MFTVCQLLLHLLRLCPCCCCVCTRFLQRLLQRSCLRCLRLKLSYKRSTITGSSCCEAINSCSASLHLLCLQLLQLLAKAGCLLFCSQLLLLRICCALLR